ncbi:MAG: hypothetical protein L0956_10910, partial [Candidatus Mariimomonas ferrooxydans]
MNNDFLEEFKVLSFVLTAALVMMFTLMVSAGQSEDAPIGTYSLDIQNDVENSILKGLARITV